MQKDIENTTTLIEKLFNFQSEIIKIERTNKNPFFKSKYTPLEEIMKIIQPILTKYGIVISSEYDGNGNTIKIINKDDTKDIFSSTFTLIEAYKNDIQKIGAFITYTRRFGIVSLLNLTTEEDDDGNTINGNTVNGNIGKTVNGNTVNGNIGKTEVKLGKELIIEKFKELTKDLQGETNEEKISNIKKIAIKIRDDTGMKTGSEDYVILKTLMEKEIKLYPITK